MKISIFFISQSQTISDYMSLISVHFYLSSEIVFTEISSIYSSLCHQHLHNALHIVGSG